MIDNYFDSEKFSLFLGDCNSIMPNLGRKVDLIFADPPYFLSNDGFTVKSGNIVSVNKGDWDKLENDKSIDDFNYSWLENSSKVLNKDGSVWISGTMHNIYSIVNALDALNFKILNLITWQKTNPPPNFSKRTFTHSTEIIIWARKEKKIPHYYNYELMKEFNDGKQMKDVWVLPSIAPWETKNGKHPVQKPLSVLSRVILAGSKKGSLILDPFTGSSTTGIAACLFDRNFIGIDINSEYLDLSLKRLRELESINKTDVISRIKGVKPDSIQKLDV